MNNVTSGRRHVACLRWAWLYIGLLSWLASLAVSHGALLGFRQAVPGYTFTFPADHAAHPAYRTEWWYYTGHLRTPTGKRYGYQLTFFRHRVDSHGLAINPSKWFADQCLHGAHGDYGRNRQTLRVR